MDKSQERKLLIRRTDRVFIVGATGSGKTTLAKALLWKLPHVVIFDPKRTFTLPVEWPHVLFTSFAELQGHEGPITAIYRPTPDELEELCDPAFRWVFERGNTTLYVDEVMSVTKASVIPRGYAFCLQLGREKGIATWNATQRPSRIPLVIMTESEHWFIFRLRSPDDRDRIYDYTGRTELRNLPRHEHGFFVYNNRTDKVTYFAKAKVGKVLE